jgi:two-component system chemotaxis response regulator CheY
MANILVVDDSTMARRNLAVILKQAGHNIVAESANGMQAYSSYEKHHPDLVTMDITMPVMKGLIHKKNPANISQCIIIIVSALNQRASIFEAIQSGRSIIF